MLIVDASCLFEVVAATPKGPTIAARIEEATSLGAPHAIDVEVISTIRSRHLAGDLDATLASLAVARLRDWNGERFPHQPLLERAWELRANVRGWDAMYVALAESLAAPLLTTDARLASTTGPRCAIEVLP